MPRSNVFEISPMLRRVKEDDDAPNDGKSLDLTSGYFPTNPRDLSTKVSQASKVLGDVSFDTIVCTGVSGIIFASPLAMEMKKHLLIVRKNGESSHGAYRAEGTIGRRWLFVDDFISSGTTFNRVNDAVDRIANGEWYQEHYSSRERDWDTHCVGVYEYQIGQPLKLRKDLPREEPMQWSYGVKAIDWNEVK